MYSVQKRDGKIVEFNLSRISDAIRLAFEAQEKQFNQNIIDFLALKVTADFETKINKGLLTRSQAEEQQQRLLQRQQNLQDLSQQKQYEMAEEEAVMSRKVMDAINTYLEKYNKEKGYALILTTSAASNTVIVGNPALDITQDVLTGLNDEYIKSKKQ